MKSGLCIASAVAIFALATAVDAEYYSLPISTLRSKDNLNVQYNRRRYEHLQARNKVLYTTDGTDNVNINFNPSASNLRKRDGTSAITNIHTDVIYTMPVSFGTPAQTFNMALDTGSYVTWVDSVTCLTGGCARGQTKFNCAASTSCQTLTNANFTSAYVGGDAVSGDYIGEAWDLAGMKFTGVVGLVTSDTSTLHNNNSIDGLMGLWYVGATTANIPVINRLKNTTLLTNQEFGIWIKPGEGDSANNAPGQGGEITFGGLNAARYTGAITWVNVVASRPWTIPVAGVAVNGAAIAIPAGATAAIDTGSTAITVPQSVSNAINSAIPGARMQTDGSWIMPCSGTGSVSFTFGTYAVNIPYVDLSFQSSAQQGYCLGSIMSPGSSGSSVTTEWIIGDTMLKNVYSAYDFSNTATYGRIGFAALSYTRPGANASSGGTSTGSSSSSGSSTSSGGTNGSNGNKNSGSHSILLTAKSQVTMGLSVLSVVVVSALMAMV